MGSYTTFFVTHHIDFLASRALKRIWCPWQELRLLYLCFVNIIYCRLPYLKPGALMMRLLLVRLSFSVILVAVKPMIILLNPNG